MFRHALVLGGFEVREASDVPHALQQIDLERPDLIVLDLMLPGLGGLTVQQEISAHLHTRDIPIIVVTGSTMNLDGVPVACVLRKPVTPEELVPTVRKCIEVHLPDPAI